MTDTRAIPYLTSWSPSGLADVAESLARAEHDSTTFILDLTDESLAGVSRPSAIRLYVPSVMVVANLLVGRFRDVSVTVLLPSSSGLNLQLARGGCFSLWRTGAG